MGPPVQLVDLDWFQEILEIFDISFFIDESIRQKTTYEHILTKNEHLMEDLRSTIVQNGEKMLEIVRTISATRWLT